MINFLIRISAYAIVAIVSLSYAIPCSLWLAIAIFVAAITPVAALAIWDNLYGVHAETRRLIAEGHRLAEETAKLPQSY